MQDSFKDHAPAVMHHRFHRNLRQSPPDTNLPQQKLHAVTSGISIRSSRHGCLAATPSRTATTAPSKSPKPCLTDCIHLDQMPAFDYDTLLWGKRQIRSAANMTCDDARDFLALAAQIGINPQSNLFPLDRANEALQPSSTKPTSSPHLIVP